MGKLDAYIPIVEFLGHALGEHCEVVLHDVTEPEHSIEAIANGHLSGRHIGGSLTDFTLKLLRQEKKEQVQYVVNYRGQGSTGHSFRSSSYFIKDEDGTVQGVLCLNYDVQPYVEARNILDQLLLIGMDIRDFKAGETPHTEASPAFENFYKTAGDAIDNMIDKRLRDYPVEAKRLSVDERMQITHDLNDDGLFLLKGGISVLADRLGVSEPTIYRYLNRIRKE